MPQLVLQKSLDFIQQHKELAFATSNNNKPQLRIMQLMGIKDNKLCFATSPKKAVWRELLENQYVEFLAYANNISVRIKGITSFNVDASTAESIFYAQGNEVLPRLYKKYQDMAFFYVNITHIDYFDLAQTPPQTESIELT